MLRICSNDIFNFGFRPKVEYLDRMLRSEFFIKIKFIFSFTLKIILRSMKAFSEKMFKEKFLFFCL